MEFDEWVSRVWAASRVLWSEMDTNDRLVGFSGDDLGAHLGTPLEIVYDDVTPDVTLAKFTPAG